MKNKINMKAQQMDNTIPNIMELEILRFKAYGLEPRIEGYTLYQIGLEQGTMIPFGLYMNNQLVAGCYVSANENTLFIEQLFVHPHLQNSGLKAGRLLLNFILVNKKEVEKHFDTKFSVSALEPSSDKARAIYEKMGYVSGEQLMRKPI